MTAPDPHDPFTPPVTGYPTPPAYSAGPAYPEAPGNPHPSGGLQPPASPGPAAYPGAPTYPGTAAYPGAPTYPGTAAYPGAPVGATLPYPQQGGFVYDPMMVRPSEPRGQALSAMIVGIASAVLGGLFGFMVLPGGIVALVLGILALRKRQPRGFALTGIITGSWTILISLGMLGLIIFAVIVGNS